MTLAVRVQEQELDRMAIELFTQHEAQFTPLYPWVLIRVLPREQRYMGRIILPDNKSQNKPVHEGIVLHTWMPRLDKKNKVMYSELHPGDHVVYPHFAGLPIPGWDERYYRIVPECVRPEKGIEWNGIIMGKLNYPRNSVRDELANIIPIDAPAGEHTQMILDEVFQKFDVVYKEQASKTLSGGNISGT
jgi:co-chaperonin GroES (HSP10)